MICFSLGVRENLVKRERIYTIGISGFSGDDNVGDDLLQIAVIKGIQRTFRNGKIVIFTSNVEKNIRLFKREGLDHQAFDIVYSGRWGLREPHRKNLAAYYWIARNLAQLRKCDMHLIGPGNMIKDNTNPFLASFWILRGFVSHFFRKPFALFAVGVADVHHFHSKFLIEKILNKAHFITTRDSTSLAKLRQLRVTAPCMDSFPDLTYTLSNGTTTCKSISTIKKIGLNFANFSRKFFKPDAIENYQKVVLGFMEKMTEQEDCELVFFPFSGVSHFNDNIMYEHIASEMAKRGKRVTKCTYGNVRDLREQISTCDAFVGTRFHSIVFAVQGCVPTVAISYDWKAKNFMTEAGFGDYALQVSGLTLKNLFKAWDTLKHNHVQYRARLEDLNERYHALSLKHFDTLKNSLQKYVSKQH